VVFYVFCFSGGYEGAAPPYSTFPSCLSAFIRHPEVFVFSLVFKCCGPRLKNCRGDELGVIETFRGDDLPLPSFPKSSIGNPRFCFSFFCFKYHGPLVEPFRGDGQRDDRSIQGQAKSGSKVAGVTNKEGRCSDEKRKGL